MIGQTISHYKILEKLGEGGMGVVYKAHDIKLDRDVALKFLPHHITATADEQARFLQEARAASALNHPNVCTIYDIAEHDGQQFIVMECIDGKTLRQMVPVQKTQTAIDYAIEIGEALQEAHSKGIVHRDIKTDNIMVNSKNQIKVMDFGLAKLKGSLKLTKTSSTVGTLAYMAPEQIQGGEVDARSDIFSFGVVLYEMLTGHLPFRGEHEAAMMYSIVNEEAESLQKYLPDASSELLHVMNRALEKDPEDRYQSVHDMVIDLRRLKKQTSRVSRALPPLPRGDYQASSSQEPSETLQLGRKPLGKINWATAGAIVMVVCVIGWLLFHPEPRRTAFKVGHAVQLTSDPGIEIDPVLSPDGKMIAYVSYFKGTLRVQMKQVTGGHTICLTDELSGYQRFPQWSADGSEIAFYSLLSQVRYFSWFELSSMVQYVVPALGGTPRKIGAGTSSPDGKRKAITLGDTIYTQPVDRGELEMLCAAFEPHSLSWSPDGSLIAFVSGNPHYLSSTSIANIAPSSIYVVAVTTRAMSRITDNASLNMSPVWVNDGRHLLFVSNCDGTRDIYSVAIDRSGKSEGTPERLTTGLNAYTISLSVDSKTLAYSVLTSSSNIWSIRIPESGPISVKEATQVTTGNQAIEGVAISPDGKWLLYDSNREGNQDVFKVLLKGGDPIQLTMDPRDDFLGSWSPDGKMIAFYSFRTGNRDLFTMLNDGNQQQQITHDPAQERHPEWSPDGNQLVFHSDKSGQQEIYVISKKAGSTDWDSPRQITFDGGFHPRWSPDGLWIAYISESSLRVISPKGGTPRVVVLTESTSTMPVPAFPAWSPDSRTIFYKAFDQAQRSSFWAVPLSGGRPRLLVRFDDPGRLSNRPEFTTDGQRLFFTISKHESDIWKRELIKEE